MLRKDQTVERALCSRRGAGSEMQNLMKHRKTLKHLDDPRSDFKGGNIVRECPGFERACDEIFQTGKGIRKKW
ncbi:hypothetical protein PLACP1_05860 [Planifilum fimeticola]